MEHSCYIVIDTNVLVSALITRNEESPTVKILQLLAESKIVPVYSTEIVDEYKNVLRRPKFHLPENIINSVVNDIKNHGIEITKIPEVKEKMLYPKDVVFYAVTMAVQKENALLVTGNGKHFPVQPFIVNPAQLVEIIKQI
jgi:probable toxin-antitoxin system toxin component, PIN family